MLYKTKNGFIEKKDNKLSRIIILFMLIDALNVVLQMVFKVQGSTMTVVKILLMLLFWILLLDALFFIGFETILQFVVVELLASLPFIYSFCVGVQLSEVLNWSLHFHIYLIPLAFCASKIDDCALFYNAFVKYRWVLLLVLSSFLIFMWRDTSNNMSFSYALLPLALLSFNELINGKRIALNAILGVGITIVILISGSRGPILWIVAFLAVKILYSSNSTKKKIRNLIILLLVGGVIYFGFVSFMNALMNLLAQKGMYSRTLSYLINGNFAKSDSRIQLWEIVIQCIKEKPWFGWGIGGAVSIMQLAYPHNIFLEPFLAFGIPIGIICLCLLIRPCISMLLIKEKERKDLVFIFFCCGFLTLLLSNSVFSWFPYYIFFGFARPQLFRIKIKTSKGY